MNYKILTPDPLRILGSTRKIIESAERVFLNDSCLEDISQEVSRRIEKNNKFIEKSKSVQNLKDSLQLVFLEDTINYCFWSPLGLPRWLVEYPSGIFTEGGWYGLIRCLERALAEKIPFLSASYLAQIKLAVAQEIFRSVNQFSIPLLLERVLCLKEAGKVLLEKYAGQTINLLEEANGDAITLVKLIVKDFPSFRDINKEEGESVFFLKRAQIVASDIDFILKTEKREGLKNSDQLTAFADYKLPQVFNTLGIIHYNKCLFDKIKKGEEIISGSREELEIRASTIWGVELIRQKLKFQYPSNQIDYTLWLMSQEKKDWAPHHRTVTIHY